MIPAATRNAIKAAVTAAAGLEAHQVRWAGSNEVNAWAAFPTVDLDVVASVGIGVDETRVDTSPVDSIDLRQAGNREITIQIKVETDRQIVPPALTAAEVADRIRTRLRRESTREILRPAGVALVRFEGEASADFVQDDREFSASIISVTFGIGLLDDPDTFHDYATSISVVYSGEG